MIRINDKLSVHENEIEWNFSRASGPGGQKVNKTASAVQLRFDIQASDSLPLEVKDRLMRLASNRVTKDGVLILDASEQRSQAANRQAAIERFVQLLQRAWRRPARRKATKPSRGANERRLRAKKRRSEKKRRRRFNPDRDW
jgi:ribosome-associated protein